MSLRIGDRVEATINNVTKIGIVRNLKWNLVHVEFDSIGCEWIDSKYLRIWKPSDTTTAKT